MEPFPYRIERLTEDRLPEVQRLLAEVMHQKVSLDYIRHKYNTSHTGHQYLSGIAYDGALPIAFYGSIPQIFTQPSGERFIGCHTCDSMTLDAYQRQGVHQRLALTTYEWMRAEGVAVVYAFHSENTYHSCKKLEWKEWGRLKGYWVKAARIPWAKIYRRLPLLKGLHKRRIERQMAKCSIAPQDFVNSNASLGLAVEYSPAFWDSKAFHLHYLVQLEGVKFWLSVDAVVRVGDAHFKDAAHFWTGMAALQGLCSKLGFDQILFQTFPGSSLDAALATRLAGFDSWIAGYLELEEGVGFDRYLPNYADQDSF